MEITISKAILDQNKRNTMAIVPKLNPSGYYEKLLEIRGNLKHDVKPQNCGRILNIKA